MSLRRWLFSQIGILIFLLGEVLGLTLSGAVTWGELEARIRFSYSANEVMPLECPLMISPSETGTIHAQIVNQTEREVKPVVVSAISQAGGEQTESQTFILEARAVEDASWEVNSSNVIFGNLILVNIFQSQYRDNPSRLGSCGILFFNLFGLRGAHAFAVILTASLAFLFIGGGLWFHFSKPLNENNTNAARAGILLAVINIAALLCLFPRLWGLILIFDAFSLLAMGVILIEFILFPQRRRA